MCMVSKRAYPEFEAHVAEPWHKLGCGAVPSISTTPFSGHPSWGPTPGRRVRFSCSCFSCSVGGVWSSSRTSAWWVKRSPRLTGAVSFLRLSSNHPPFFSVSWWFFLSLGFRFPLKFSIPLFLFLPLVQGIRVRCCLFLPCCLAVRTLLTSSTMNRTGSCWHWSVSEPGFQDWGISYRIGRWR